MKKSILFFLLLVSLAGFSQKTKKDSLRSVSIKALRIECIRMAKIAALNTRKTHTIATLLWASRTSHWVDIQAIDKICDSIIKADKVFP
jgi:hypothetical protein